jgi:hypothetical protein
MRAAWATRTRIVGRCLAAFLGAVLCTSVLNATASAATEKTWDLTHDFGANPQLNPAPDQYGDTDVWSWMYGEADTSSSYALGVYTSPKYQEEHCPVRREWFYWGKGVGGNPLVVYNAGPTVERGTDSCAGAARYATKTVFVHPEAGAGFGGGGKGNAIVAWKSPVTGVVNVSGSVEPVDSGISGIAWELDQGSTILLGPTEESGDSLTSFGPVNASVTAGESLYFEIGPKPGSSGNSNSTAITFTIVIPAAPLSGHTANLTPVSGAVQIKLPGTSTFVALSTARTVPVGTIVNAAQGRVTLCTAAKKPGTQQCAEFYGGMFQIEQKPGDPNTHLVLVGGNFAGCRASRPGARATAVKHKRKNNAVRSLWGSGHGSFTTDGRNSSATVRGTIWYVQDTCTHTLTKVKRGVVSVLDYRLHRTVLVHAGHSYTAKAP